MFIDKKNALGTKPTHHLFLKTTSSNGELVVRPTSYFIYIWFIIFSFI